MELYLEKPYLHNLIKICVLYFVITTINDWCVLDFMNSKTFIDQNLSIHFKFKII
jgi:hypothetical protein